MLALIKKVIAPHLHRLCDICELPLQADEDLWCRHCQSQFLNQPCCSRCGLPTDIPTRRCGECIIHPPLWQRLYCLGGYQYPLDREVRNIKYHHQFWRLMPLVSKLSQQIDNPAPLIIGVPLHWTRRWRRGFNQSDLLAKQLAQQLGMTYQADLFVRTQATPYQRGLNKSQREVNLYDAFAFHRINLPLPEHVAICDDVVTTGSTVNKLCQLLLDVGVKRIDIYCLCRTAYD